MKPTTEERSKLLSLAGSVTEWLISVGYAIRQDDPTERQSETAVALRKARALVTSIIDMEGES